MIGGFALIAYPAKYASSGIMTFIVNHDGVVYQKDLGRNTEKAVQAIKLFNPDTGGLESSLRRAQNALAILLGMLPGELKEMLNGPTEIPVASEAVIIDIPNNLLRRRPDIRLAELQIATQSPQIGIAKADLYPQFFLFGNIGWRSSDATSVSGQNSLGDI